MRQNLLPLMFCLGSLILSCKKSGEDPSAGDSTIDFNFTTGTEGWIGDFADYPNDPNVGQIYQLEFTHAGLPAPLNASDGALKLSGINRSDDLFMFVKNKITGLVPLRTYTIQLTVDFATNAANNMVGVGGSPGEGVWVKAGAVTAEPKKVLSTSDNYYRMNLDKGNQSQDGADMKVIGNFANGSDINEYRLKKLSTTLPISVKAGPEGEFWLVIGTDSGFEGKTAIYYTAVKVFLK